jgi:hypothetical protein
MAKRTRQQKIISCLDKIVLYGYDNGIWPSLIIHSVLLTVLALVCGSTEPPKPIAIELSFTDSSNEEPIEDIAVGILPSLQELSSAVDALSGTQNKNADDSDNIPSIDIENIKVPSVDVEQSITYVSITDIDSLLTKIDIEDESLSIENTQQQESSHVAVSNNDAVSAIMGSLQQGIDNNTKIVGAAAARNNSSGGDIEGRLSAYGAKTGDVQISLAWNTIDDVDLHVKFTPGNGIIDSIDWTNRIGRLSNGMLDIDMNANSTAISQSPVENIFWPPGSSPNGFFTVYIHFFRSWTGNQKVPVVVRIKNGNKIEQFTVIAQLYSNPQIVKQFSYPLNRTKGF